MSRIIWSVFLAAVALLASAVVSPEIPAAAQVGLESSAHARNMSQSKSKIRKGSSNANYGNNRL